MFRHLKGPAVCVCALLSIWICGIIICTEKTPIKKETAQLAAHEYTLIIDPGHGGLDGGAVSITGTRESEINWQIAVRSFDLARFLGIDTVMTRYSEQIDYPADTVTISERKVWDTHSRAERINAIPEGILLSIHQNTYPTTQPSGVQVFYGPGDKSRLLAGQLQEAFMTALQPANRRVAAPIGKEIYILNHVDCPSVLVECGFLSHPREAELLETKDYQIKLAMVMAAALCRPAGVDYF